MSVFQNEWNLPCIIIIIYTYCDVPYEHTLDLVRRRRKTVRIVYIGIVYGMAVGNKKFIHNLDIWKTVSILL